MVVLTFIQNLLNAQFGFTICPGPGIGDPSFWINIALDIFNINIPGTQLNCPASTFSAVSAAYATLGYYAQSDMLDMLSWSNFNVLAPLVYCIAAVAGFVSLAVGQPPRIWVWYFLGPALYSYLIYTRVETTGVRWQIGHVPQNGEEVWRIAEVGVGNLHIMNRPAHLQIGHVLDWAGITDGVPNVWVSDFFLWYDATLSSFINDFVSFVGPYSLMNAINPWDGSNVSLAGWFNGDDAPSTDRWYLLSNLKWSVIENITSAKLTNPAARDAFATFMGSLCGEAFAESVDIASFTTAANARGANLPETVFKHLNPALNGAISQPNNMEFLARRLRTTMADYSNSSLQKLLYDTSVGSFRKSVSWVPPVDSLISETPPTSISCATYLEILIAYFRWEAARIFVSLVNDSPNTKFNFLNTASLEDKATKLVYNLFYGWDIKKNRFSNIENLFGNPLDPAESRQFLMDLILIHLMRNEFAIVTQPVDVRFTGAHLAKTYSEGQMRTVGSKSKFGEMYIWATLMPYAQGLGLYYLAMLYPFACIMMLVPGMHKSLITWMTFWGWLKLWDVGFALVTSIEKTVWASIGSSSRMGALHSKVVDMQEWGHTNFDALFAEAPADIQQYIYRNVNVCLVGADGVLGNVCDPSASTDFNGYALGILPADMLNSFKMLDRAMTIGPAIDLDLSNSYYIYIMAALYFAVPAVAAQLVLGAKAGAASLMTHAFGQNASEAGRAAGSGYSRSEDAAVKANFASIGQAAAAAAHQKSGFALEAIEMGNAQTMHGIQGSAASAMSQGLSQLGRMWDLNAQKVGTMGGALHIASRGARELANHPTLQSASEAGKPKTGTDGMTTSGGLNSILASGLNSILANGARAMSLLDTGISLATADAQIGAANRNQGILASQAGLNVSGFRDNSMASAYNRGAGMKEQQAQFAADSARWDAQNRMSTQLAGSLAARGVSVDGPGPKPSSMMGMATSGMLGGDAQAASSYFFGGGGAWGAIDQAAGAINSTAGEAQVASQARDYSYGDVMKGAVDSGAHVTGGFASHFAGGDTPQEKQENQQKVQESVGALTGAFGGKVGEFANNVFPEPGAGLVSGTSHDSSSFDPVAPPSTGSPYTR